MSKINFKKYVWFDSLPEENRYFNKAHPIRLYQNDKMTEADSFLKKIDALDIYRN